MNNINNILVTKEDMDELLSGLLNQKVSINNIKLFINAFMHKSFYVKDEWSSSDDECYLDEDLLPSEKSNERLEFLGDSLLNMACAEYIFEKYPKKDEGFMTKLRTKLVRNTQLSHLGSCLGFSKWLLISNHAERIGGRENPRLIEDVFESFIGALYKDQGFYIARNFVFTCFDKYVNVHQLATVNDNFKDMLLRFFQINEFNHPEYNTFLQTGGVKNREFTTAVIVEKVLCENSLFYVSFGQESSRIQKKYSIDDDKYFYISVSSGKTKKISEQNASKLALKFMNVADDF
jgi:ribonuclease-3